MEVKVQNLSKEAIDWVVAKIETTNAEHQRAVLADGYSPSTDWAQGGPIIEWEKICSGTYGDAWYAQQMQPVTNAYGPTPLIAAMRCYIASKLGDSVEIPDELISLTAV